MADVRNFLFSDTFADVAIVCHGKRIPAHRIILCSQSTFFQGALTVNMKEKLEGVIKLPDDLDAVEAMLMYLYQQDYTGTSILKDEMILHAKVYIIAEKYGIPNLKILAHKRFESSAEAALQHQNGATGTEPPRVLEEFLTAVNMIFEETMDKNDGMRERILQICKDQLAKPDMDPKTEDLWMAHLAKSAEFAFRVVRQTLRQTAPLPELPLVTLKCPDCNKTVQYKEQDIPHPRDQVAQCFSCGQKRWFWSSWIKHGAGRFRP